MNKTTDNPYVGPRTFLKEEGHLFFGRDREARDLSALVLSDKLVLFYAQSGAGKSSLINTRLIPELENKLYEVLRVARVSGELPEGLETNNIYIYNLLRSLIRREIEPGSLANLSLSQFLGRLNEDENGYFYDDSLETPIRGNMQFTPWQRALIIDQFEEIFSTHSEAWEKRADFFSQIAQAMQDDPYLWIVLVMREDYIAAMDPYAHLLPGGLRTRYYMQRLSRDASIKAVRKPVEKLRPYADGVAEKLVEDLSSIKVKKPDGTQDFQPGQYVEPVQLQVVCYGLWDNLPTDGTHITEQDLLEVGDVDDALGKYFATRIATVAKTMHVKERLIRDWIEKKLIAPGGIRSMVLQETNKRSAEISDDVIRALQSDLVRAETRGGAVWYELTHDRLVSPILENNKKWFDENLSPLQRQATLWNDQERNESWLLRDQALVEVENWAKANPDELTDRETEFLEACRKQQAQIELNERASAAQRLLRFVAVIGVLGFIAIVAAVIAIGSSIDANRQAARAEAAQAESEIQAAVAVAAQAQAETQKEIANQEREKAELAANQALAGNLVAQVDALKNNDYPLALLLGIEAYEREDNLLTRTTLFELLQFTPYQRLFGFGGPVSTVAVSPDGALLAAASCSGDRCRTGGITLINTETRENPQIPNPGTFGVVRSLTFYQYDTQLVLAAGGCVPAGCADNGGQITVWDVSDFKNPVLLSNTNSLTALRYKHTGLVKTIAFRPDGQLLASGSYDTTIILWDVSDPKKPSLIGKEPLKGHSSFVNSLAFSPDGNTLVSAGDDRTIRLWNVSSPANASQIGKPILAHTAPVNSIAFSPDEKKFVSSGNDNEVLLWDWAPGSLRNAINLDGHTGYVTSVAFNADGTLLASAGFDNRIILWETSTGQQIGPTLSVHSGAINSISFGNKLPYLISGSNDGTVIQWDLSSRQPLSHTSKFEGALPSEDEDWLTDSVGAKCAVVNGPQVNITLPTDSNSASCGSTTGAQSDATRREEVFVTVSGFDSPVQYVRFNGQDVLRTMDQFQLGLRTRWITSWNIAPSSWVEQACNAVNAVDRALTEVEVKRYLPGQESISKTICASQP